MRLLKTATRAGLDRPGEDGHSALVSLNRRMTVGALLIALTGILATGGVLYIAASRIISAMAEADLTHLVEATCNMVRQATSQAVINHLRAVAECDREITEGLYAEYLAGRITEAEAQRLAERAILSQTVGISGYVYCVNSYGVIQVHPKPALRNADLSSHEFIRDQMRRKQGYIEYDWRNPGESNPRATALFMTYFEPWDWIISASSYREEFYSLISPRDLQNDILGIRVGETGYPFVLDRDGVAIVHPTSEGSVISRDAKGREFVKEMLARKNGTMTYWWRNPGETQPRAKLVVYRHAPELNWTIAGGLYLDELYRPLQQVRRIVVIVLAATCGLVLILLLVLGGRIRVAQESAEAARKELESQLRQSQKLEAIGQLAAGIAHEINTPTQYVGDNTLFLEKACGDLLGLLGSLQTQLPALKGGTATPDDIGAIETAIKEIDLDYLTNEIPTAIKQTMEGVERVTRIVRAMKDFSHPDSSEKSLADISKVIESTLTVARNEWKYVADLVTDFDPELPAIPCLVGELSQVILNLVINAVHAITEKTETTAPGRGTIRISTRREDDWAVIRISDTGIGIPESIRDRIFDPFFTTKEVGKGTGQGLAISHQVIVKKHGGSIDVESAVGQGTTFIVRLPLMPDTAVQTKAA